MKAGKLPASHELSYALSVREAMSRNVIKIRPSINMRTLRNILKEKSISGAPVLSKGELVGIISLEDLLKCVLNGEMDAKVEDEMTRKVVVCHPDDQLIRAVQILEKTGYGRLPVVDRETGKLRGILTKSDIVLCLLRKLEELYDQKENTIYSGLNPIYKELRGDYKFETSADVARMDFSKAGSVSSGFRDAMTRFGVPPEYVRRTSICAYEAEMNMVIYSGGGRMGLSIRKDRVTVTAFDNGPGIDDVKKAMTPGYSTAPDWVRELGFGAGMGLPNIKNNSDRFSVKTKKDSYTKLTVEVGLP